MRKKQGLLLFKRMFVLKCTAMFCTIRSLSYDSVSLFFRLWPNFHVNEADKFARIRQHCYQDTGGGRVGVAQHYLNSFSLLRRASDGRDDIMRLS
jgi:hypothetical protein